MKIELRFDRYFEIGNQHMTELAIYLIYQGYISYLLILFTGLSG